MSDKQSTSQKAQAAQFESYALASGARVTRVSSASAVAEIVTPTAGASVKCAAAVRDRFPAVWQALLSRSNALPVVEDIAISEPAPSALATKLAGDAGLVVARAGVAETGSVLLADDALAPRLLSMLSETCFVLLPSSAILPDLDAVGALIDRLSAAGHRYMSLVTGPSRTADIERVLTIGVQGPKVLHVLILMEDQDAG